MPITMQPLGLSPSGGRSVRTCELTHCPGKGNRPRGGGDDAVFRPGRHDAGRKGQKRTLCQPFLDKPVSTLGAVSATGLTVGRDGVRGRSARVGNEPKNEGRRPKQEKMSHTENGGRVASAFFDNSDAVMDRDMAFLASNDASRAMRGGRETTEYTEQRTSGHTRSGPR